MNNILTGYCGINCTECDVFKASVSDDNALREKCVTSSIWQDTASQHWGIPKLTSEMMNCKGCSDDGEIFISCAKCPIRRCARSKKNNSCGECQEWQSCKLLAGLLADIPQAKINLINNRIITS